MVVGPASFSFPVYNVAVNGSLRLCGKSSLLTYYGLRISNHETVRQMSSLGHVGGLLGRVLRLRYLVLTGAVGGGITAHQVVELCWLDLKIYTSHRLGLCGSLFQHFCYVF